jgi:peptidoglycan L-alanyl-D-glutamate endopeptidase CwlK
MKNYETLINELQVQGFHPTSIAAFGNLTRQGIAPEGKGSVGANRMADLVYSMPADFFRDSVPQSIPIPPPAPPPVRSNYKLGARSLERLESLKPKLADVVKWAIKLTTQDFTVLETLRTLQRQKELLASGATRTLKSKHLMQSDGYCHAVDLGAWNDGAVTWGFHDYYEIVQAMDKAATEHGVAGNIRWGGIWDRTLGDFGGFKISDYEEAIEAYKIRHKGPDFLDGPHFEWVS